MADDNSQQLCLEEASVFHMPYELRRLFAILLVYSCPNSPPNGKKIHEDDLMPQDQTREITAEKRGGKTYLYRALLAKIRSEGHVALATATSRIAASILPGGRTAHSRFKIPLDLSERAVCRVSKQSSLATFIKDSKLIIREEAPVAKRSAIEALNNLLQDLIDSTELFGGKVVVLGGDFRQTLPVVCNGTKSETIDACLTNSPLWPSLHKLYLKENMRALLDPIFIKFLMKIGDGTHMSEKDDLVSITASMLIDRAEPGLLVKGG
ncbi:ATP-dependent DNA helicase PIF1-like protein [Tanacetum coccineum]